LNQGRARDMRGRVEQAEQRFAWGRSRLCPERALWWPALASLRRAAGETPQVSRNLP